MMKKLFEIKESDKKKQQIRCPHCFSTLIIRHGTYQRAHPQKLSTHVKIQRYLCKSNPCPGNTFSVLPYPFLRVVRHFFTTVLLCRNLSESPQHSQASIARQLRLKRGRVKRLCEFCQRFIPWFRHERRIADWGPSPEENPNTFWFDFIRDFSHYFYQTRWGTTPPTQHIPV